MQFSTVGSSKMKFFKTDFSDVLTIHNDQISNINHVLDPLYVFFLCSLPLRGVLPIGNRIFIGHIFVIQGVRAL